MLQKIFTIEGIKAFFKVRDPETGKFSWEEFGASAAQIGLVLLVLIVLHLIGII